MPLNRCSPSESGAADTGGALARLASTKPAASRILGRVIVTPSSRPQWADSFFSAAPHSAGRRLLGHPVLFLVRESHFRTHCTRNGLHIRVLTTAAARQLSVANHARHGNARAVRHRDYEPAPLPVQLVTLSRSHVAPKVRAFLDSAVKTLRDNDIIR